MDSTLQDAMNYMLKLTDKNCFAVYIVDYIWKVI